MTTSTGAAAGIATAASVQANIAQQAALRAECLATMPGFAHDTATVEARQDYAACVRLVHPDDWPPEVVLVGKGVVLALLIAAVVGGVRGYRGFDGVLMGALGHVAIVTAALIGGGLLLAAIAFLFL